MNAQEMRELIETAQWDELESAWMDAIEAGTPAEDLAAVLEALAAADKLDLAETLGWMLLEDRAERHGPAEALEVAKAVVSAVAISDELRTRAAELYRQAHPGHEHLDDLLAASGLTSGQSPRRAFRTLETCLSVRPGQYLANRFDRRVLKAAGYDPAAAAFRLTDAAGAEHALEPKKLADEFEPVDETDFRVLAQHRRDQLAQILEDDPVAVLIGLCQAAGGQIDSGALKDQLAGKHMPAEKWNGWWGRARTAAKRSEVLSVEGRNPVIVSYHPQGRTLEQELSAAAAAAHVPQARLEVLRQYVRQAAQRKLPVRAEFAGPLLEALAAHAQQYCAARPADALAAALGVEEMVAAGLAPPACSFPSAAQILAEADDPAALIAPLEDVSLWPRALDALCARPDAPEHLARLLPRATAETLDELARRLRQVGRGEAVEQAVAAALADPQQGLKTCLWLWKGPEDPAAGAVGKVDLLGRLLGLLEQLHTDGHADAALRKDVSQRVRAALSAASYRTYKDALDEMTEGVAATMKRRIERCDGLAQAVRGDMIDLLRERFYTLFIERRRVQPWEDETAIYVTEAALRRRQEELKKLREVTIPANARAIGQAAAHGDLSENSEWKFAIEERDRLAALANKMQNELLIARAIHPGDAPEQTVGIGSRVVLERAGDGARVELRFLGPWDVDVDRRVFSYQSQLGREMMGKALGEAVELRLPGLEGTYRIAELGPALA